MKVRVEGGRTLRLTAREFVAEGGEGKVWARKGVAYKVYADPARVLPQTKIAALQAVASPNVVVPDARLLHPDKGNPIGYSMRHVARAWALGQLFARSFCDRHGFGPTDAHAVLGSMRDAIAAVHRAGVLIVDLSDVNVLIDPVDRRPSFIDTDSWQTPGHPATAVTPAVCDPFSAQRGFSEGSDWFAFAVLSFQLLVGIHPFRGKHPQVKGLAARMAAGLSVLDPDVSVPSACRPLSVIPPPYRAWFDAMFVHGRREPPPPSVHATSGFVLPPIRPARAPTSSALRIDARGDAAGVIRQVVPGGDEVDLWLLTAAGVQRGVGGPIVYAPVDPHTPTALGRDPKSGAWLLATVDDQGCLALASDRKLLDARLNLSVGQLAATPDGRIVALSSGNLVELEAFAAGPHALRVVPRTIGQVLPHATMLASGVAIQNVLGRARVSLLSAPGLAPQLAVPALDGLPILDARYERGVLVVVAQTPDGGLRRVIVRCEADGRRAQTHVEPLSADRETEANAVDFVVTDAGIAVLRPDADTLQVFERRAGRPLPARTVATDGLGASWLARGGDGSVFAICGASVRRIGLQPERGAIPVRPAP